MGNKFLAVGEKNDLPASRKANVIYWCSDTREIYKGMELYTEAVRIVSELPETPATGILYILPTREAKVWTGSTWNVVALPYVTAGTLSETSTDSQVPTAKVVYDSIAHAIENATGGGDVVNNISSTKAGTITVTKGETPQDLPIKGVIVNPSYDADTRTITLPYADGTEPLVITLGKDVFIDATKENKYNAETKCIELYLNDGTDTTDATMISIPAAALIDVYTGGSTASAKVNVSDDNKITADVIISKKENNAASIEEDGLYVDVSGLATKKDLEDAVGASGDLGTRLTNVETDITTLKGNKTVTGSVDYKIDAAKTEMKTTTDNLQSAIDAINSETDGVLAQAKAYTDDCLTWATFDEV